MDSQSERASIVMTWQQAAAVASWRGVAVEHASPVTIAVEKVGLMGDCMVLSVDVEAWADRAWVVDPKGGIGQLARPAEPESPGHSMRVRI
jgi:hypothetical protein